MRLPWKRQDSNELLTVSWSGETLAYTRARLRADGTHNVLKFGVVRKGADSTKDFVHRLKVLRLNGLHVSVMLRPEQYQFLRVDTPAVPPEELHSAIRYQIKDMLKAHVDDITLDVMRVGDDDQGQKKDGQLFVVAADNAAIREVLALGDAMNWNVSVIDIQETAQRNLQSALAGKNVRGLHANPALVLSEGSPAVLTISANDELFYARRFELPEGFLVASWEHGSGAPDGSADFIASFSLVGDEEPCSSGDDDKVQRFLVEVQASLDMWSRSWANIPLDGMHVYAGERSEEFSKWFGVQLGQTILPMDVSDLFPGFEGVAESDKALCLPLLGVLIRAPLAHMLNEINIFTHSQLTQKHYFSAQTMLRTLAVFVVLGGCLSAAWLRSLHVTGEEIQKALASQSIELESLQVVIAQRKTNNMTSADPATVLEQELQAIRTELLQREKLAQEWQRGRLSPGSGHAALLGLVAQSIPAQVWVTEVNADETQFEISGFTLEPEALSEWVVRLAASPLLEQQKLSAVNLENASAAMLETVGGTPQPVWSFSLLSAMTRSSAPTAVKP
ncbi:MAG: MSHA biogenesis protein MshI [Porticoccus sp.]|jgi:MSHA biogenesis protein MshI